ncbi:SH3 domain-containing protein [Lyngbya confervoides]|uniref:SH3 domain-containing protein n=1 Tax=Lyngbya confervoides BDU141951 TaxID=1574623 RepID=A0ABD4T0P1_9CYAN|nr:SH3 domain-containing protein [Lyngbya confervoides]MCM1982224.1 SH3 domain-containing protein [Lyngbya confervoides BDU141951]
MVKLNKSVKIVGLITLASALGYTAVNVTPQANADSLKGAIATYGLPQEYNPSPEYYVPGELYSSYSDAQINVRTGPGTYFYPRHYGLSGDRVTILNEAHGNDGYRWWYLKFNESGAKGWVREDLVLLND